jgi:hypothetical protein
MPISATILKLVSTIINHLPRPIMKAAVSESRLVKKIDIFMGNLQPVLSVSQDCISPWDMRIFNSSIFRFNEVVVSTKILADGVEISPEQMQPGLKSREIESLSACSFRSTVAPLTEEGRQVVKRIRSKRQVSAVDYLDAVLAMQATMRTFFREISVVREFPLHILIVN